MAVVSASRISVIVPQWGQFLLTAHLIDQLWSFESHDTELIVVDDGSPELETCPLIGDPRIRFLNQPHTGVTSAWNRGARQARGDFLVFLNNDAQLTGSFLDRLVYPLGDSDIVMTGCRWRRERRIPLALATGLPRQLLEGWCFAVRRNAFELIGGFDERLRLYFSDTDLQWRLLSRRAPARLEQVSDLPLSHHAHASTRCHPQRRELHAGDRRRFLQIWSDA